VAFGLASPLQILVVLPLAFLGGLLFGSLGMICTALVPGIEYFNYPIFLLLTRRSRNQKGCIILEKP
jgi:lipooligosaccharide transport system permease protein